MLNSKPTIFFYGSCHMSVVAKYFADILHDQFNIISCKECGLEPFWGKNTPAFSPWTPQNSGVNKSKQYTYFSCIHEKLKQTDIFVFQDFSGYSAIDQLKTEYLCTSILPDHALKICVTNLRFYTDINDIKSLTPWIWYAKEKTNSLDEAVDFLHNSDDPQMIKMFQKEFPYNKQHYEKGRCEQYFRRAREQEKYDIYIDMLDWIEEKFEDQLITYCHNHPVESYFKEMMSRLFVHVDVNINQFPIEKVEHPSKRNHSINPMQFKFFRTQFPNKDCSTLARERNIRVHDLISI